MLRRIFMIVEPPITLGRHEKKGESGKADNYVLRTYIEDLHKEYIQLKEKMKENQKVIVLNANESIEMLHLRIKDRLHEEKVFY